MDARFKDLVFASSVKTSAFTNLCNSIQIRGAGAELVYCADTTLRLDSPGFAIPFASTPKGVKRKWNSLGLNLGHFSSSSDSKGSLAAACTSISSVKGSEESSMDLGLDFTFPEKLASSNLKSLEVWPKVDLQLSLSNGSAASDITTVKSSFTAPENVTEMVTSTDEVSTGSPFLPLLQNMENICFGQINQSSSSLSSSIVVTTPKSSVTCTSGITQSHQRRSSSTKQCQVRGCMKGSRGASGLCIAHGGGRRCQRPDCHRGAEGRTVFCKAHGGGRRCEYLGCTKSADGRTQFCIAHGGGRRCSHEGCIRAARGKSGLCIRHGGGKRCKQENCTKSAEGRSGLCISHGGGRRCRYPECNKGAQGSTMFCKAHGGGKRCTFRGCNKGAEGSTPFCKGHGGGKRCSFQGGSVCPKSVHGGTLFCVAHGGGKRCAMPECTKSARGRTNFCVRHGGGKRCKFEGCGKSAQGSTDFCKAHGGGKRCSWGHPGSELGQGDGPCESIARGKAGLCVSHGASVKDKRVHSGLTLGTVVQDSKAKQCPKMRQISAIDISNSTVTSTSIWRYYSTQPEGRVHGGNLMAMLACSPRFNFTNGEI